MKHGGPHAYNALKCRCDICVEWAKTNRQRYKEQLQTRLASNDPSVKHGWVTYSVGCRCELCLKARDAHSKKYWERTKQLIKTSNSDSLAHGTKNTYNAGCRCDQCIDYYKKVLQPNRRIRQTRNQSSSLETATNHRKQWTSSEIEVVERYTTYEAARLLGRTYWSVHHMKKQIKNKNPKIMFLLNNSQPKTRGAVERPTSAMDLMQSA